MTNAVTIPGLGSSYAGFSGSTIVYAPDSWANIVAHFGELVGTGGDTFAYFRVQAKSAATCAAYSVVTLNEIDQYMGVELSADKAVSAVRSAFQLSVTDLSVVLQVERPTIYSWLKGASTPGTANAKRLAMVVRLADVWRSATPGGAHADVKTMDSSGVTILDALGAFEIDEEYVSQRLRSQIAMTVSDAAPKLDVIALARRHGATPRPDWEFDMVTGRPLGPELE